MSRQARERGPSVFITIPTVPKETPDSPFLKALKKELKNCSDTTFMDNSYKPFKNDKDPTKLNWECPCVDNLPYGPCGPLWRNYMIQKEVEGKSNEETYPAYTAWWECFTSNPSVYMPEFMKSMERKKQAAQAELDRLKAEEEAQKAAQNSSNLESPTDNISQSSEK